MRKLILIALLLVGGAAQAQTTAEDLQALGFEDQAAEKIANVTEHVYESSDVLRFNINAIDELFLSNSALYPTTNDGQTLGTTANGYGSITLVSPDGSTSTCEVDNSDNLTCTGN